MEEMMSARQYALATGRKVRTVQGWVDREEVIDVQKVGTSWVASRSAWDKAAAMERRRGPKGKEKDPVL